MHRLIWPEPGRRERWRLSIAMLAAALLTFVATVGVVNAEQVGEEFTVTVNATIDPSSPLIFDATTPLHFRMTLERDGGPATADFTYTGPAINGGSSADWFAEGGSGFTADEIQTAFGLATDAGGDTELATNGVDLPFSVTLDEVGDYVLTLDLWTADTLIAPAGSAAFTVDAAPPPPPVEVAPPLPIINVVGVSVTVENQVNTAVVEGSQAVAASKTLNGVEGKAMAPAGVLPAGGSLSAATVINLPGLLAQAPAPDGATALFAWVFEAKGPNATAIEGDFSSPVTLVLTLPAGTLSEGTASTDLVLVYWDGAAWVEVDTVIVFGEDGSATIVAEVDHFTVFALLEQPGYQVFDPAPAASGITLASWGGGRYSALDAAVGEGGSAWVFQGGQPLGYVVGAPAFVNEAFLALFLDGLPQGTPVAVVTR